jgi:hypothetical protein
VSKKHIGSTSKCLVKAPNVSYALKNQYANGVLVCIFLKALIRFETTIPPKWLKFLDKIFKIFIRKRCNYRIYIVDKSIVQVRSCFGQLQPIRLWQKHQLFFIDGIRFIHANQIIFLVELFQIVANSETSSMEIVWVTFAEAVVLLRLKVPKRSRTKFFKRSINMNRTFWEIAVLIVDFLNHFQLKHPHANSHCTNYDFQIHFLTDGLSVIISILLCGDLLKSQS